MCAWRVKKKSIQVYHERRRARQWQNSMKVIKRRRETNQTAEITRTKKVYIPRLRAYPVSKLLLSFFCSPSVLTPIKTHWKSSCNNKKISFPLGLTHKITLWQRKMFSKLLKPEMAFFFPRNFQKRKCSVLIGRLFTLPQMLTRRLA
jgi:hypothetical protein